MQLLNKFLNIPDVIRQLPNIITALNLISGSIALLFAVDGHLIWAGIFICMAAVFDFLDGFVARLLNSFSEFGKQLDSLADLVSFGLAPATILFTMLEFSLFKQNQPVYDISASLDQWLILFSALLMPVLGAVRLGRYNIEHSSRPFFRGLPIPANGLFWASLGLMLQFPSHKEIFNLFYSTPNLILLNLFISGMMVISLPMFSLKFTNFKFRDNWYRYLFLLISLLLLAFLNVYGLALSVLFYIILNIVFYLSGVKF